jgi:glycosyltransferase involved in cell wall biosynthesis
MKPYGYWLAQEFLESLSLPRYNEVFCNSEYSRRGATPNAQAARLMPNPVRLEFFGRRNCWPDTAVPVLLNIGVIQERKRQVELCRMAIRLHRQGHRFLLRFIGFCGEGQAYTAEFRHVFSEAKKLGCAEYAGLRSAPELVDEMDRARALIHFPKEEAFGLVVAEALSRNLKIFAADLGGIPDILQGAAGAELFPADAWGLLENRLASWLKAGAPCASEGAKLARQRFHPQVIAGAHLEAYRRILSPSVGVATP